MPTLGVTPLSALSKEERTRRAAIAALVAWTLARPSPRSAPPVAASSLDFAGTLRLQPARLPDWIAEAVSRESLGTVEPVGPLFDLQRGGLI